jgi:hypothetical protein
MGNATAAGPCALFPEKAGAAGCGMIVLCSWREQSRAEQKLAGAA